MLASIIPNKIENKMVDIKDINGKQESQLHKCGLAYTQGWCINNISSPAAVYIFTCWPASPQAISQLS